MFKQNDQLKRIEALFDSSSTNNRNNSIGNNNNNNNNDNSIHSNEITIVEKQKSKNCTVHSKRRDSVDSNSTINYVPKSINRKHSSISNLSLTKLNNSNGSSSKSNDYRDRVIHLNGSNSANSFNKSNYNTAVDIKKRNSITSSSLSYNKDINLDRRQSFSEGNHDRYRKRNSWNSNMFKNIEHPSAFPSLLRSSNTTLYSPDISTSNRNGSISNLSSKSGTNLTRRSSMSVLSVNRAKSPGFGMSGGTMMRNKNFGGSSIFLRPDSSGNTNLVRRDSIGSKSITNITKDYPTFRRGSSVTRDYVSDRASSVLSPTPPPSSLSPLSHSGRTSILRKSSFDYDKVDKGDRLTKENLTRHVRILENEDSSSNSSYNRTRRQSNSSNDDLSFRSRRMSMDSLDWRRGSIENDLSNLNLRSSKYNEKTEHEHHHHHHEHEFDKPQFVAVTTLKDTQAIRCAEFHPKGKVYAVGSNSRAFRICEYPALSDIRENHVTHEPTIAFKRNKHHKGSIYCIGWAPDGELLATGSNDKTIKLMRYDETKKQLEGRDTELTMHDGTVRDLCFLEDTSNKSSLLISGGAGDCKIYVTDCATATPFQALSGHGGTILSLYNWGGAMFVSGSQDKTIRFWDLRTRGCVNTVTPATTPGSRQGSPVAAVCVDPSGRLLVSGHEDSSCVLYDIRGNRPIQCFKPHTADLRSIRFSPSAYYLLTGGYDHKLALTDLQGDLTLALPTVTVAYHSDKVISGRWHPKDFSFISTSADKTVTLWALPPT